MLHIIYWLSGLPQGKDQQGGLFPGPPELTTNVFILSIFVSYNLNFP